MNTSFYKCCAVPMCKNTSISTPQKLFINVPKSAIIRRKWLKLAGRNPTALTATSTSHFCEDHFDLQTDMENYVEYTTMSVVSRIRMRPGCLPTKFACQPTRANTSTNVCQPTPPKRQRLALVNECEEEIRAVAFQQSENINVKVPSQDEDPLHEQELTKIDKALQTYISAKHRSKTTQTETQSHAKQTAPIKFSSTSVSTSPFKISEFIYGDLNNDDKSYSYTSLHTSSIPMLKASSYTSSFNQPKFKTEANLKCLVEQTVDKIEKRLHFYIGVPKDCHFLIRIINEHTGIPIPQILLCLKKIRLDSKFSELSDEFEISKSYACKMFTENVPKIAAVLRPFIVELDKSSIKRCLPLKFRHKLYNVTCIIDCLEIEVQKSDKALNQYLTWSEYKKANTVKYLISCTSNGLVNYISQGYGGRISEVCLFENCGFLNRLPRGSHVMAGRGFKHIESLLLGVGCQLIGPPSIVIGNKSSKEDVKETKIIASVWDHIETIIRGIKEFSFLKPHTCVNNYLLGTLDDVTVIACALINLHNSLIN